MFGLGWMKLQRFMFMVRNLMVFDILIPQDLSYVLNRHYCYDFNCGNLKELSLGRIITVEEIGLCSLLGKCKSLEKLCLHIVLGVTDSDMVTLAQNCSNLKSITLQLEPAFCDESEGIIFRTALTDESLKALALGCRMLQVVELTTFGCDPTYPEIGFSQEGLVMLFQSCPIRDLVLCGTNIFDDEDSPSLINLTLRQCGGFTDDGVGEVVRARKLNSLIVEDCRRVSSIAMQGAAKSVHYDQDSPGYGKLNRSNLAHLYFTMEDLPDALISEITKRIENRSDLSSLSLVSKRLYKIEAETRGSIHVGCGLHPATDVILSLCSRFPNLLKVDINYSGWTRSHGNQLDNHGICILSSYCPGLSDLTLSFCSDISDSGIGYLASCKKLITLRLNSAKIITSSGLLAVVVGCNNLSGLHLVNCNKICGTSEWLKYLGCNGSLEELVVKNCEQISQFDLLMFGPGWMKLKSFMFVVRSIYNIFDPKDRSYVVNCKYRYDFCCENLKELSLERIVTVEEKGLCSLLGKCRSLEKVCLHFIHGLTDSDMITLAQNCSNLRCISLQLEPVFCEEPEGRVFRTPLTDQSLKVLALGCRMLQIVELTMFACEPIYPEIGFTQEGLVSFFQSCPIRDLVLCGANIFNDEGMKALSSAHFLETLELMDCKRVTDAGVRLLADSPSLVSLTLRQCDGFSDVGVGAVVCARKLESLIVEGCHQVSQRAV
uniref:F-box domain-containing protein n=1 Tax=Leersia perrieri TaxID=77586 RepID=A0A0D9XZV5_9ORYZ